LLSLGGHDRKWEKRALGESRVERRGSDGREPVSTTFSTEGVGSALGLTPSGRAQCEEKGEAGNNKAAALRKCVVVWSSFSSF